MPMPVINESNELVYIEIDEVFCIYKDSKTRKIVVKAECGKYYIPSTIEQINLIMKQLGFALIDSNRIINIAQVKSYENGEVHVDGKYFYVSRRNRANLKRLLDEV